MEIKNLYKYDYEDGVRFSLTKPSEDYQYELAYRIIADEGMAITNDGENFYYVLDVVSTEGWYEVEYDFESEYENKINIVD